MTEIISGKKKKPFNVILYGVPGIGKSTWAAACPKPIFLGPEENDELDAARFPIPASYDDLLKQLTGLVADPKGYKTVVIDTLDGVEKLAHAKVLASDSKQTGSMMAAHGGYAKAYEKAETELFACRALLKTLRDKHGMHVVLLAHSKKAKATDTVVGLEYDTYELNLHAKAQSIFVDWVSAVLFANYSITKKDNDNSDKVFAMGHGTRVLFTDKRPGYLAKNRYDLPHQLDLEFADFFAGYETFYDDEIPKEPGPYIDAIMGLMKNLGESPAVDDLKTAIVKSVEDNKTNVPMLQKILARVQERTKS
jgi:hypothetical protein